MLRRLTIVLAAALLLLTGPGGPAVAQAAGPAYDHCLPGVDDSACIPPDPIIPPDPV